MRFSLYIMPLKYLIKLLEGLTEEQLNKMRASGDLTKIIGSILECIKTIDDSLAPIDVIQWGHPIRLLPEKPEATQEQEEKQEKEEKLAKTPKE